MALDRKRPEDFLELVERAKRGRLKVYIGPAAGVGKTYQMLERLEPVMEAALARREPPRQTPDYSFQAQMKV